MAMAALHPSDILYSSSRAPRVLQRGMMIEATLNVPYSRTRSVSVSNLPTKGLVEELELGRGFRGLPSGGIIEKRVISIEENGGSGSLVMEKLRAILEAVADRVEMHKNIGEQRDNWNGLLLTSINTIILAAATTSAIAATSGVDSHLASLKLSSALLYMAATGMLIIVNKIQPSQLVEEQRNAARLFRQLHNQIRRIITIGNPTDRVVKEAMEKVLALDKAYPLPLLGAMLDKFPSTVEPAVWWPQQRQRQAKELSHEKKYWNGWNGNLEEEMRKFVQVIRRNDKSEYLRLGGKALKLNKLLAISGPLLTGLAAVGSSLVGSPSHGSWAAMLGIVAGTLATVVNTIEHGGQVGMVFEMYRSNAGFFKLMEESIESNLMERKVERRENGELLEMKVALQLGRSLSELRELASISSSQGDDDTPKEFASKLF